MSMNLSAVFRVRDQGTSVLRRITRTTQQTAQATQQATRASNTYRDANGRLHDSMGRFVAEGNRANTMMGRFRTSLTRVNSGTNSFRGSVGSLRGSLGNLRGSFGSLQSSVMGIAGAYLTARGAAALFNNTIGEAAKFEQSEVAIKAIFNDDDKSSAYLKLVDKMAIDSPLLNSGEMLGASKSLVAMTKNVGELGDAWSIIERLMVLDPTQGTEGAAFALKEMWQGDALSMVERFGLNKQELNRIKKLKIPQQIAEINALLDGMGITQATVNSMGETTLGYWAQIGERADKFKRTIGEASNGRLKDVLKGVVDMLDSPKVDEFATILNNKLADVVEKVINIGQKMWEWREPIGYIAGALALAFGAFATVGIVSALASPLSILAAVISFVVVGFKALYEKSEGFRAVIDGIKSKVSELWNTFKEGGTGGLLNSLFGEGTSDKIGAVIGVIKDWFMSMLPSFISIKDSLVDIFSTLWTVVKDVWALVQPLLLTAWEYFKSFGGVIKMVFENIIAPQIAYFSENLKLLWSIAQPILALLVGAFDVLASVVLFLWDMALAPLLGFITGAFGEGLKALTGVLETVGGWFEKIGEWTDWAHDKLSDFASFITGIKVPDWITNGISTAVDYVGGIFGNGKEDGSHFHGLARVPYDGYAAILHRNEMVLSSQEADQYRAIVQPNQTLSSAIQPVENKATNVVNNVIPFPKQQANVGETVNKITSPAINIVVQPVENKVDNIIKIPQLESVASDVTNVFKPIINAVAGAVENVIQTPMQEANESLINNVIQMPSIKNIVEPVTSAVTNIFKPIIDIAVPSVENVIQMPAQDNAFAGVSYDQVQQGITNNQTSNYYNTINGANNGSSESRVVHINPSINGTFHIREDADVDKIVDQMVTKLIEAEAAGV